MHGAITPPPHTPSWLGQILQTFLFSWQHSQSAGADPHFVSAFCRPSASVQSTLNAYWLLLFLFVLYFCTFSSLFSSIFISFCSSLLFYVFFFYFPLFLSMCVSFRGVSLTPLIHFCSDKSCRQTITMNLVLVTWGKDPCACSCWPSGLSLMFKQRPKKKTGLHNLDTGWPTSLCS